MVLSRARSLRRVRRRMGLSSCPVLLRRRSRESSSARSRSFWRSSSAVRSRISLARIRSLTTFAELCGHRELVRSQPQRLLGHLTGNALHLEEYTPRFDHRHPELWRALAFSHAGLGWLLGYRLVGKDAHPDASAALDM